MRSIDSKVGRRQDVFAAWRVLFGKLKNGEDIPKPFSTTKISVEKFDGAVSFIFQISQFRPGKSRSCLVHGDLLKDLPYLCRYSTYHDLYCSYRKTIPEQLRIGQNNFRIITRALTRVGTFNQGLSYYYVDFINLIGCCMKLAKRLKEIAAQYKNNDNKDTMEQIEDDIKSFVHQTKIISTYLRHELYSRLKNNSNSQYACVSFALGGESIEDPKPTDDSDKMILVLTADLILSHIAKSLRTLLLQPQNEGRSEIIDNNNGIVGEINDGAVIAGTGANIVAASVAGNKNNGNDGGSNDGAVVAGTGANIVAASVAGNNNNGNDAGSNDGMVVAGTVVNIVPANDVGNNNNGNVGNDNSHGNVGGGNDGTGAIIDNTNGSGINCVGGDGTVSPAAQLSVEIQTELKTELLSVDKFANLMKEENLVYAKHIFRGWHQETEEAKIKNELGDKQTIVVLDHKGKTPPMQKWESMSNYFGKKGMSGLRLPVVLRLE